MSRPGLGPPAWEASTLEKSHLDSLYAGYSEPLLMMRLASLQTSTEHYKHAASTCCVFFPQPAENVLKMLALILLEILIIP